MKSARRHLLALALTSSALHAAPLPAAAQTTGPIPKNITYEPRLGERAPLDVELVDDAGRPARLGDYVNDARPLVLVLAYYECPMLCSMVLNGVTTALRSGGLQAGADFELVVVSIDPSDTPERARAKKASYVRAFDRPGADQAFHFMTGREAEVRRVADAVGFTYEYDPIGKQFAHPAGLVVLTPAGVISRYFYGVDFPPRDLRLSLVEAAGGAIGTAGDKLMLLCFRYDPERGRYGKLALGAMRVGGVVTLALLGASMALMSRRSRGPSRRRGREESRREPDNAS